MRNGVIIMKTIYEKTEIKLFDMEIKENILSLAPSGTSLEGNKFVDG